MVENGWIKIHRKITKHWIFSDSEKFKSWIIILLTVNHEEKKVLIGEKLFMCKRGESLNSLDTWSKLFGRRWNKSKVRRFFELLKKDSMIELKNEQKTTRLTVCNYDSYQEQRNVSETSLKRNRNVSETSLTPNKKYKNYKNDKNEKNNIYIPEFLEFLEYSKTLTPYHISLDFQLKAKYDSWKENKWRDYNNKPIKNWKNKISQTISYFKKDYKFIDKSKQTPFVR